MITITANARDATYVSDDLITSGSVGIPAKFVLSEDFDGLSNVAVFVGSGVSMDVALPSSGECVVPHEVVAQPGGYLKIGVYGRNAEGTIVIPTVWAMERMILQGTVPSGVDPSEPTPDWTAQVQQMATEALEIAQNVEDMSAETETLPPGSPLNVEKTIDPETGAVTLTFYLAPGRDGVSPTIAVEEITGGHRVTVTDVQGTRSFDVLNGTNGRGIASAVMNADYTLTLTYTDGTSYTTPSLRGEPGVGVPAGGTAGQVLKKASGTDYDTEWGNEPTAPVQSVNGQIGAVVLDAQDVGAYEKPSGGIPASDLAAGVVPEVPVQDVQVNGVSVLSDGVANVPVGTTLNYGVIKLNSAYGLYSGGNPPEARINGVSADLVKAGANQYRPITPYRQHESTFYGLAKAAGADEKNSSLPVGQYTEAAKSAISQMLNGSVSVTGSTPTITALPGIRYVCGEVATLDITLQASGIVDVVFESGSTPTVLTITPPTGVTVKWANGFDPTSLDANTTYEINIADGLGVAASWT